MTIRKLLIFENADECGHRHSGHCEHPLCPNGDGICPTYIATWCPLPDAPRGVFLHAGDTFRSELDRIVKDVKAAMDRIVEDYKN